MSITTLIRNYSLTCNNRYTLDLAFVKKTLVLYLLAPLVVYILVE